MAWIVEFDPQFVREYDKYKSSVKEELVARALLLEAVGPFLGRPHVDTLNGSAYPNMKELRF
jgi:hypothetical protein